MGEILGVIGGSGLYEMEGMTNVRRVTVRTPFGDPAEAQEATVRVDMKAIGWSAHTVFPIPVTHHELRLSLESELADRRGLPR